MSEYFIFDGVDCRDFFAYAFDSDTHGGSGREYQGIEIPGKSGNLLIDNRRYSNRSHAYHCIIFKNCEQNLDDLRNFLLSRVGYCRLEDSIHPEEFYQAVYSDDFSTVVSQDRNMCKFLVTFERKPQRYLKSGEIQTQFTASGTIVNPTRFPAYPLLRVYGSGNFKVGDTTITVTGNNTYIDIDCEVMEAYTGYATKNSNVSFSTNDFPVLSAGSNTITLQSGISKVIITPHWYKM